MLQTRSCNGCIYIVISKVQEVLPVIWDSLQKNHLTQLLNVSECYNLLTDNCHIWHVSRCRC